MIVAGFAERKTRNGRISSVVQFAMTGKWFWTAVAVGMLLVASSTGVRAEEEEDGDELKTETVDGDLGSAREGSR